MENIVYSVWKKTKKNNVEKKWMKLEKWMFVFSFIHIQYTYIQYTFDYSPQHRLESVPEKASSANVT